jgi:hypothetical protein
MTTGAFTLLSLRLWNENICDLSPAGWLVSHFVAPAVDRDGGLLPQVCANPDIAGPSP